MTDEANSPEDESPVESEDSTHDSSQSPEDTAEAPEIQGKESSEGPADEGSEAASAPEDVTQNADSVFYTPPPAKTLGEAIDQRLHKMRKLMVEKEGLTVSYAMNARIHAAYNAEWREDVRKLFRLQTRLQARKAKLTQSRLEDKVVPPLAYACSPEDIANKIAKGSLPINKAAAPAPEDPFAAAEAEQQSASEDENPAIDDTSEAS